MADADAAKIVLLGVADFGATPMLGAGKGDAAALASALSRAFNEALSRSLAAAGGVPVVAPDGFAFFNALVAHPAAHGFANVSEPGVHPDRAAPTPTGNSANSNPAHLVRADAARTHLFSDALHPSGRGHELLGEFVLRHLPEAAAPARR